jgi:hypothetical protein
MIIADFKGKHKKDGIIAAFHPYDRREIKIHRRRSSCAKSNPTSCATLLLSFFAENT